MNVLSVEQMQTLRDLGLEMKFTPYAYYKTRKEGEWQIKADNDNTFSAYEYYAKLPIYGLEKLIDTLPNKVWIDTKMFIDEEINRIENNGKKDRRNI